MNEIDSAALNETSGLDWSEHADTIESLKALFGGGSLTEVKMDEDFVLDAPVTTRTVEKLLEDSRMRRTVGAIGVLHSEVAAPRNSRPRFRLGVSGKVGLAATVTFVLVAGGIIGNYLNDGNRQRDIPLPVTRIQTTLEVPGGLTPTLRWNHVLNAITYEVTITTDDGTIVLDHTTEDTSIVIPDSLIGASERYFYRVRARVGEGRWVASEYEELPSGTREP